MEKRPPSPRPMLGRARLWVRIAAALLALGVLAALGTLVAFERSEALKSAEERNALMARTLEDHVTRTVGAASLVMQTLAEGIHHGPGSEPARLQALLGQPLLASLPFLRSAAVLDEQGLVLATTQASDAGLRVDLRRLGPMPADGAEALRLLVPGRSLADLSPSARKPRATGVGVLPLLRTVRAPSGQRLLLVALINPGALANFQQTALSDHGGVAVLAHFSGQLIASQAELALEPGASITGHPVFEQRLPAQEHGVYRGAGLQAGAQVVAFRTSRTQPLVVLVEQAESAVLAPWRERLKWLSLVGVLALAAIGAGALGLLREMHARERARQALDKAHGQVALRERELSVLLKSVQELIFRTDAHGAITYVNARWSILSKEGPSQARGRRLWDLVAPADRERTAALFRRDERTGVRQAQICIPAAQGQPRHFLLAVAPLHGDGQLTGFAGSAVDVSERVAAEQELQHQLAFSSLLLELSPLPVSMMDAAGRYVMVNQAWEDFMGLPRADVVGTPAGYFLPAVEAGLHAEQDAKLRAEGGRVNYEAQLRHRDGTLRTMMMTKVLVPGGQNGQFILCTLMDISEYRDAERATREARDAAEEASRAKSEFIANISHELRTPLQAILGFSELGLTRGHGQPKLASMFTDIHHSGQRMLALVNDLLDVAKIESAAGTLELERCDLRDIVKAVLREVDPLIRKRRLTLKSRVSDFSLVAKVDPLRIHQAIRNVVANAIKFSPEGGVLEIEAVAEDEDFRLSVGDRGPGIPPAELESIFEAFVQSSKTKDGSGGTGLGLAICRKILEVHGGRITAENRSGGGAMFRLWLPLRLFSDSQVPSTF